MDKERALEAIYDKCQKLAAESALAMVRAWQKRNPTDDMPATICQEAQKWVAVAEAYRRGMIDEETAKSYFHLGYVPEYSPALALVGPGKIGPLWRKPRRDRWDWGSD